jgi:hypothetical protein
LHRLYYAYAVHPDTTCRCSTSRQSVALALVVCPVIPLCVVTTVSRPQRIYFAYAARLGASARRAARCRLLRLHRASGCLGTSHDSLRDSSRRSSSTTSPTPRVRVPRYLARLVAWLIVSLVIDYFAYVAHPIASDPRVARRRLLRLARLVVDYFTSRRLVVDYFAYAVHPGALARRATRHAAHRRLLHIARLVIDYFAYAARPGASARRAAHRRLLRLRRAARLATRCRLLRLRHASGCLGTSRGSSRRSSSTNASMPHVWVPRHLTRLVAPLIALLIIDYFAYATCPGASAHRAARHAARRRLLCALQPHRL